MINTLINVYLIGTISIPQSLLQVMAIFVRRITSTIHIYQVKLYILNYKVHVVRDMWLCVHSNEWLRGTTWNSKTP